MLATCSPEALRGILSAIGSPCFVLDVLRDGGFRLAGTNARAEAALGLRQRAAAGRPVAGLFAPDLAAAFETECRRCAETCESRTFEMPDGTADAAGLGRRWWRIALAPLVDTVGEVARIIATGTDISSQRRAEQALQDGGMLFRAVIETLALGIAISEIGGRYHFANPAFQRMLGYDEAELCRLGWAGVTHPDEIDRMRAYILRLTGGEIDRVTLEKRYIRKTGEILWAKVTAAPARLGEAATPVVIGVIEDITARKAAEATLTRAKEEAERVSLAKTRFLAAASHDLRQPLQAMILFHDLLAQLNQDPRLQGIIDRMGQSLAGQKAMVETLLDVSKLDAGAVSAEVVAFPLRSLMQRLAEEFGPVAAAAGLRLRWVDTAAQIRSDPLLLERILRNLLSNAIKYNERGRVLLGCRRAGEELRIQVLDTGIGIEERHLPVIFEEFYQVGDRIAEQRNGLGLGLSIVDRLARLLGHRVAVCSSPGRGSCFEVVVPLCPAPAEPASGLGATAGVEAVGRRPAVAAEGEGEDEGDPADGLRLCLGAPRRATVAALHLQAALAVLGRTRPSDMAVGAE